MAKQEGSKGKKSVNEVLDNAKQKQNAEAEEDVTAEIAEMPEIMDVKDFRLIDKHVTASIMDAMSGVYQQEVVYNIPKRTQTGKTSWPACKRMPNGYCNYEGKDKHIHILGISYAGALIAASVYGGLDYGVRDMPVLMEFGDKPYWICEVYCNDLVRRNSYSRWQFELSIKSSGGGFYTDEFAMLTVQSKGVRNMILACIPQRVQEVWKADYIAGRTPFDPQAVLEAGYRRQPEALPPKTGPDQLPGKSEKPKEKPKDKPKPEAEKPKPKTQGVQDLEEVCKQLAQKIGQPADKILQWTGAEYDSPGKAMTSMVNAMENPAALKTVRDLVAAYTPVENGTEAEGGAGASAEQEEMKL